MTWKFFGWKDLTGKTHNLGLVKYSSTDQTEHIRCYLHLAKEFWQEDTHTGMQGQKECWTCVPGNSLIHQLFDSKKLPLHCVANIGVIGRFKSNNNTQSERIWPSVKSTLALGCMKTTIRCGKLYSITSDSQDWPIVRFTTSSIGQRRRLFDNVTLM